MLPVLQYNSQGGNFHGSLHHQNAFQMWSLTPGSWSELKIRRKRNQEAFSPWVRSNNECTSMSACPRVIVNLPPCPFQESVLFTTLHLISGLSYPVYKGVMKKGYKVPTPIQRKVNQCHYWSMTLESGICDF